MCRMEGESLGDYITCGTFDVLSGRHMKGWCLMKSFKALSLSNVARQYHYCLLFIQMWQSRVEIKHYSVVFFDRIIAFEAL